MPFFFLVIFFFQAKEISFWLFDLPWGIWLFIIWWGHWIFLRKKKNQQPPQKNNKNIVRSWGKNDFVYSPLISVGAEHTPVPFTQTEELLCPIRVVQPKACKNSESFNACVTSSKIVFENKYTSTLPFPSQDLNHFALFKHFTTALLCIPPPTRNTTPSVQVTNENPRFLP